MYSSNPPLFNPNYHPDTIPAAALAPKTIPLSAEPTVRPGVVESGRPTSVDMLARRPSRQMVNIMAAVRAEDARRAAQSQMWEAVDSMCETLAEILQEEDGSDSNGNRK